MVTAVDKARRCARAALESTYEGTCDIIEYRLKKDLMTKITAAGETIVLEGQPCRLSYKTIPAANQSSTVDTVSQVIKLFLAPEIEVKPGSKIIITQNERMEAYKQSGKAAIYPTHQEINLELYEERA